MEIKELEWNVNLTPRGEPRPAACPWVCPNACLNCGIENCEDRLAGGDN